MSKIQDLIDLNMNVSAKTIYNRDDNVIYDECLDDGIHILLRSKEDTDPEVAQSQGYYGFIPVCSVTINYKSGIYKSHEIEGSYGESHWSEWKPAKVMPVVTYLYDGSTY